MFKKVHRKKIKRESEEIINLLYGRSATENINISINEEDSSIPCVEEYEDEENVVSSFSSSDGDECSDGNLAQNLCNWTVQHNITNNATDDLLKIIRNYFPGLPLSARTLKKTPKIAQKAVMGTGEYVHYGVEDALTDFLCNSEITGSCLKLKISMNSNLLKTKYKTTKANMIIQ